MSEVTYTPQQFNLSYGETALYLSMGDPIAGAAPVEYVKIFFDELFSMLLGNLY